MKVTLGIPAKVLDAISGEETESPEAIAGRLATEEMLADHLDADLADLGVCGGEVRATFEIPGIRLTTVYWLPVRPDALLLARLRTFTCAQLDDGAGEGGFEFELGGRRLLVVADTNGDVAVECVEDGRIVPGASRIAIAARDGELAFLATALQADPGGVDRRHQGHTALQLALLFGHEEAVFPLLAAGADPNRLDAFNATPLHLCALSNAIDDEQSREVAQALLEYGAERRRIDARGGTAKDYAELRGKRRTAELL